MLKSQNKRLVLAVFDGSIIILSVLAALAARLESWEFLYQVDTYIACAVAVACSLVLVFGRGFYNVFTRHTSIDMALTILWMTTVSTIVLFLLVIFGTLQIPHSVPFMHGAFSILGIAGLRFFIRIVGQNINRVEPKNIAIYGAGAAGRQLVEALKWNTKYHLCQIIDDDPSLQGKSLGGIKIEALGPSLEKLILNDIDTILLAMPSASFEVRERVLGLLAETPIKIKLIPDLASLIAGTADITELRDIDIVDLLGRQPAKPDLQLLSKTISGKTVLVTGAGGSIGSELCRQIATRKPRRLVMLDLSEFAVYEVLQELIKTHPKLSLIPIIGSVQDKIFIDKIMGSFAIDTIYHAAAYKHVPLMEQNVTQCITNNVFGTQNIAKSAVAAQVKHFILVSSDKAVNPTNFMGASKRLAELVCKDIAVTQNFTRFGIVRFGNVLGSSGSVVPRFKQQIADGGPVTVTHIDVIRYFMTIPEAAQLVIQAGALAKHGDVFVLDMGKQIKVLDLAKKMIILSGKNPVLELEGPVGAGDIMIRFTGLRPGEKMFEELSYSRNLTGTSHPRILKTDDSGLSAESLKTLLNDTRHAIENDDHKGLIKIIRAAFKNVPNEKTSSDVFFQQSQIKKTS